MNKEKSLVKLGIDWSGKPNKWLQIPKSKIPYCTAEGEIKNVKGEDLFRLKAIKPLGSGTFGMVDEYEKIFPNGEVSKLHVAMKRPKDTASDLLSEALFQWSLHEELIPYGLSSCVPKVYDVFVYKPTGDVWFTMECFEPQLLSQWCSKHFAQNPKLFPLLLLQIALILEVLQKECKVDHRDLKVNNMLVLDEPVKIFITWNGAEREVKFPFRVVLVDFGWACIQRLLDLREGDGLPPLDPCPKEGRDIFQVLVSIWSREELRRFLGAFWGGWIRERIRSAGSRAPYVSLTETHKDLNWMYPETDRSDFKAPLCAPKQIIQDCMRVLEE
jgi:serine/threonine protein kinase